MAKITYPNKSTGDQFKATEANEIKASVNSLYDSNEVDFIKNQNSVIQDAKFSISESVHVGGYGIVETFVSPTVTGHQGYTTDGTFHYIIDTLRIDKRNNDGSWSILVSNTAPFSGITGSVNHLGDGSYYLGNIYITVENWSGSCSTGSTNQKVAVYSASTLLLTNQYDVSAQLTSFSGIAIDGSNNIAYLSSYCDGSKLWKYDATTFSFLGVLNLNFTLSQIQGVSYYNGFIYVSAQNDGIYKVNESNGEVEFIDSTHSSNFIAEGLDVISGQIRLLVDNNGDGTNSNVHYYDQTSNPQGFYSDKAGNSLFGSNLKIGNKLSINTSSKIGAINLNSYSPTKIFLEGSSGSIASITHDFVSTGFLKNAYHFDGVWNRPNINANSFGFIFNDLQSRVEIRKSKAASGPIIWDTPVYLNLKGDLNIVPDLIQESNSQTLVALDIQPTFSTGGFTAGSNYGIRVVADTIIGLLVRNPNNQVYTSIAAQDNTSTRFLEIGVKGSASTAASTYGAVSEGFIRTSTSTAGLVYSVITGNHRFLTGSSGVEKGRLFNSGNWFLGLTPVDDGVNRLQVSGSIKSTQYNLSALNIAPATATSTGTTGEIRYTATHIYLCTATNTWVRAALTTF